MNSTTSTLRVLAGGLVLTLLAACSSGVRLDETPVGIRPHHDKRPATAGGSGTGGSSTGGASGTGGQESLHGRERRAGDDTDRAVAPTPSAWCTSTTTSFVVKPEVPIGAGRACACRLKANEISRAVVEGSIPTTAARAEVQLWHWGRSGSEAAPRASSLLGRGCTQQLEGGWSFGARSRPPKRWELRQRTREEPPRGNHVPPMAAPQLNQAPASRFPQSASGLRRERRWRRRAGHLSGAGRAPVRGRRGRRRSWICDGRARGLAPQANERRLNDVQREIAAGVGRRRRRCASCCSCSRAIDDKATLAARGETSSRARDPSEAAPPEGHGARRRRKARASSRSRRSQIWRPPESHRRPAKKAAYEQALAQPRRKGLGARKGGSQRVSRATAPRAGLRAEPAVPWLGKCAQYALKGPQIRAMSQFRLLQSVAPEPSARAGGAAAAGQQPDGAEALAAAPRKPLEDPVRLYHRQPRRPRWGASVCGAPMSPAVGEIKFRHGPSGIS